MQCAAFVCASSLESRWDCELRTCGFWLVHVQDLHVTIAGFARACTRRCCGRSAGRGSCGPHTAVTLATAPTIVMQHRQANVTALKALKLAGAANLFAPRLPRSSNRASTRVEIKQAVIVFCTHHLKGPVADLFGLCAS